MAVLVFDEQLANPKLVEALHQRGVDARTVGEFAMTGRADPDVFRGVGRALAHDPWTFVTMDLTIIEDNTKFDWPRYAIAWILIDRRLTGGAVEQAKANIVQRHAHLMVTQQPGDHHTYTAAARHRNPPSLTSLMKSPR